MSRLKELREFGQSVWLDFLSRSFLRQNGLDPLIERDGLCGVTSNPTIFKEALAQSDAYDADIRVWADRGLSPAVALEALMVADVQAACDRFLPVYRASGGVDGFVSLEVNPHLARAPKASLDEARRLWNAVDRPNVMIKIPGTQEGLEAIEEALAEGIHINITLIFSVPRYAEVMQAWMRGLRRRAAEKRPLASVSSVASFFISRIDAGVERLFDERRARASDAERREMDALKTSIAVANAVRAYAQFLKVLTSPELKALEAQGARMQRPLWASTGTKTAGLSDVFYVEELIGRHTVNTMPLKTLDAFRDHGRARQSLPGRLEESDERLERFARLGFSMDDLCARLEEEGLKKFADSYDGALAALEAKRNALVSAPR